MGHEKIHSVVAVFAGGGTAVWGWVTDNIIGLLGLVVAAATFGVNWYYKHKNLKVLKGEE